MRVNRHIRLLLATLAGSLFISGPASGAGKLFVPDRSFIDRIELTQKQKRRIARAALAFPIKAKPDYGDAGAAYGTARGRMHHGQDVFAPAGTPLIAIRDGVIVATESGGAAGNVVAIYSREHDQTYAYFHMLAPTTLETGQKVKAGDRVGAVGCTGSCWGDHLHFEVRQGRGLWQNESIDPLPLLRKAETA
jgi:murein DD-endopeptidase MepM/ murein hydrolase activator NlpD